ncbi:MAG TPA: SelT/SelW/SelH family protein [Candidatus Binataceae bacterium]|nr:SelT/SelW/SelH family protein [Candidatus Binataceae bacterium]
MAIQILYCGICGHKPKMQTLAASLQAKFGEIASCKVGALGQFDVIINGRLVFSRAKTGRFPNDGEIEEIFAALRAGREPPSPRPQQPRTLASAIREKMGR